MVPMGLLAAFLGLERAALYGGIWACFRRLGRVGWV